MELNEVMQVINDGKVQDQSKDWLEQAATVLRNNNKEAELRKVDDVLRTKPFISSDLFIRNATSLVQNESSTQISDNLKSIFDKIEYVDDNGHKQKLNLSEEVFDLAKLEIAVENAERDRGLSPTEYQDRLAEKIKEILSQMPVNRAAQNQNGQNIQDAQLGADDVENLFKPNFTGKVQIKAGHLGGLFADRMGDIVDKAQVLAGKYGKACEPFFKHLVNKFNKLDAKLEKKLGQPYTKARGVVEQMIKDGTWKEAALGIGLGAAAFIGAGTAIGVGASAGLTLMTANMTRKRMQEFWKKFKGEQEEAKEKQKELTFWQFAGRNKKEVARIIFYTGATVAGGYAFASQVNALSNAGSALGAASASAAQKASMSKMVLMTSGTATPHATDAVVNYAKYIETGDEQYKKAAKSSAMKTASIAGLAGLTYLVASELGSSEAHAAETSDAGQTAEATGNGDGQPFTDTLFDENGNLNNPPVTEDVDQIPLKLGEHLPEQGGSDVMTDGGDYVSPYSVDKPSDSVQHFYENKLNDPNFIPKADVDKILHNMPNNELPNGMTTEQAINLARDERVWYHAGDLIDIQDVDGNPVVNVKGHIGSLVTNDNGTFLKIGDATGQQMVDSHGKTYFDFGDKHHIYGTPKPAYLIDVMGCDEVNVNTDGYLKTLSEAFVTEQGYHTPNGELRLLNAPTDPDYVMKGNFRHTVNVNGCDESTLTRHGGGAVHHQPATPAPASEPAGENLDIKPIDVTPIETPEAQLNAPEPREVPCYMEVKEVPPMPKHWPNRAAAVEWHAKWDAVIESNKVAIAHNNALNSMLYGKNR